MDKAQKKKILSVCYTTSSKPDSVEWPFCYSPSVCAVCVFTLTGIGLSPCSECRNTVILPCVSNYTARGHSEYAVNVASL